MLKFDRGQQSRPIDIDIVGVLFSEPAETIEITLSSPVNAELGANSVHAYTIIDNEPVVNQRPQVDAGAGQQIALPTDTVNLDATVTDDGLPSPPGAVTTLWTRFSGPGPVAFDDDSAVDTTATFSVDGVYVLQLEADDGELPASDTVTITVDAVPTDWHFVGPAGFNGHDVHMTNILFDGANLPIISFMDRDISGQSCVMWYDGPTNSWSYFGARGEGSIASGWYSRIAVDSSNDVYIVTRDYGVPNGGAHVKKYDRLAGTWSDVGPLSISLDQAHYCWIAIDSQDVPYVTYQDRSTDPDPGDENYQDDVTVRRYINGSWEDVGPVGIYGLGATVNTRYATIDIGPNDVPWVGFCDQMADAVNVMKFNSGTDAWEFVGPANFADGAQAHLKFDGTMTPYVACIYNYGAYVYRWDGANWQPVGGSASGGSATANYYDMAYRQNVPLAFDSQNRPYVAYQQYGGDHKLCVRMFDGASWVNVGSTAFTPGAADYPNMAIDGNNHVYVTFEDRANGDAISVMRYIPQ